MAAHVIHQYPVPEAMGIAKDIFKRLSVLSSELPSNVRESYFLSVLPSLALLCKTFPPLSSDATEFLVHLTKICKLAGGPLGSVFPTVQDWGEDAAAGDNPLVKAIKKTFNDIIVLITA